MSLTLATPRAIHALRLLELNLGFPMLHTGMVANERTGQAGIVHLASEGAEEGEHRLGQRGDQKLPLRLIRVRSELQRCLRRVLGSSDRRIRVVTAVAQVVPVFLEGGDIVAERLGAVVAVAERAHRVEGFEQVVRLEVVEARHHCIPHRWRGEVDIISGAFR